MIYYPIPLHLQEAYRREGFGPGSFTITERLSETVLSLPIDTEHTAGATGIYYEGCGSLFWKIASIQILWHLENTMRTPLR